MGMTGTAVARYDAAPVVGIDVGGTFTDFAVAFPGGRLVFHKEPSESRDPSVAVERGLAALLEELGFFPKPFDDQALQMCGTFFGNGQSSVPLRAKGFRIVI